MTACQKAPPPTEGATDTRQEPSAGAALPWGEDPFLSAVEHEPLMLPLLAATLYDLEKARIATANRVAQATRSGPDKDGVVRGFGLDERHPYVQQLRAVLEATTLAEGLAVKSLKRAMSKHPLGPWVKAQKGLGLQQMARLIGTLRDPYMLPELIVVREDGTEETTPARPRTVGQLWSYCGYRVDAGVAPRRRRGVRANWSAEARMRAFLATESVIKQLKKETCPVDPATGAAAHAPDCGCGLYRRIYDQARLKYAEAVHAVECAQCGPKGSPAPPGSPLSARHKKARAQRAVAKAILKDLWIEARRLHTQAQGGEFP